MSAELDKMLTLEEGKKQFVYSDSVGVATIAIGRNIDRRGGKGISEEEMKYLLNNDILEVTAIAAIKYPWILQSSPAIRDAFLALLFQLGENRFALFTRMILAAKQQDWNQVAIELRTSVFYKQVPERAERLAKQIQLDQYFYKTN